MEGSVRAGGFHGDGPSSARADGGAPLHIVRRNDRLLLAAQKITIFDFDLCVTFVVSASAMFGSMTRLLLKREGD